MEKIEPLIEAFIRSTIRVFDTMCEGTEVSYTLITEQVGSLKEEIIGIMGIGGNLKGTTMLACPSELAGTIVSRMTGYDLDELSESDLNDGIAEFLNMVCGNSKALVANTDLAFTLSVPTIISSSECKIGYHHDVHIVMIRFDVLGSSLYLHVSVDMREPAVDDAKVIAEKNSAT